MDADMWNRIFDEANSLGGDVQVIFHTTKGPSSLEKEWKSMTEGCGRKTIRNMWFPYAPYGVIEVECESFTLFGTWILADRDEIISIKKMDEEVRAILRGMGSNNIESGVLRLFSYEMIPEG
jgi:hypothetical protein